MKRWIKRFIAFMIAWISLQLMMMQPSEGMIIAGYYLLLAEISAVIYMIVMTIIGGFSGGKK